MNQLIIVVFISLAFFNSTNAIFRDGQSYEEWYQDKVLNDLMKSINDVYTVENKQDDYINRAIKILNSGIDTLNSALKNTTTATPNRVNITNTIKNIYKNFTQHKLYFQQLADRVNITNTIKNIYKNFTQQQSADRVNITNTIKNIYKNFTQQQLADKSIDDVEIYKNWMNQSNLTIDDTIDFNVTLYNPFPKMYINVFEVNGTYRATCVGVLINPITMNYSFPKNCVIDAGYIIVKNTKNYEFIANITGVFDKTYSLIIDWHPLFNNINSTFAKYLTTEKDIFNKTGILLTTNKTLPNLMYDLSVRPNIPLYTGYNGIEKICNMSFFSNRVYLIPISCLNEPFQYLLTRQSFEAEIQYGFIILVKDELNDIMIIKFSNLNKLV